MVGARRTDGTDHSQGGTMSKGFGIAAAVLGVLLATAPPAGAQEQGFTPIPVIF